MEQPATDKQKQMLNNLQVTYNSDITKKQASEMIDNKLNNRPANNSYKKPQGKDAVNFYVSYSKDVLIRLIDYKENKGEEVAVDELTAVAIHAIDQMKAHFSNNGS